MGITNWGFVVCVYMHTEAMREGVDLHHDNDRQDTVMCTNGGMCNVPCGQKKHPKPVVYARTYVHTEVSALSTIIMPENYLLDQYN